MNVQLGDTSQRIITDVLGRDAVREIERPGRDQETIFSGSGVKHIAHSKIKNGDLVKFKTKQEKLANSLLDARDALSGVKPHHGGHKGITKKILRQAETIISGAEDKEAAKKELLKDMAFYANTLLEATTHRRAELKSNRGIVDKEVLEDLGVARHQMEKHMRSQYGKLMNVGTLGADITRYTEQGKITMNGRELGRLPEAPFGFGLHMLQMSMLNLGMVNNPGELELNEEAEGVIDDFAARVAKKTDGSSGKLTKTQLSEVLSDMVKDLKDAPSANKKKLAFVLYAMSQNWVVQPGGMMGTFAREGYGHERFSRRGTEDLKDLTRFDISFEEDGSITLKTEAAMINSDYQVRGEDYTAYVTTTVKMRNNGSEDLRISFAISIDHPPGKGLDEGMVRFKEALTSAGFQVQTKAVDNSSEKQAVAANNLIDVIRTKDLTEVGVFRTGGVKEKYEDLAKTLPAKCHPAVPGKQILNIQHMDTQDLTSALKFLLRENFHLVTGEENTAAFLEAGAEEVPPAKMRRLVEGLPPEKQAVIRNLCDLCHEIIATEGNEMDAKNLAISMGPSIFAEANITPTGNPMEDVAAAQSLEKQQRAAFVKLLAAFPREH